MTESFRSPRKIARRFKHLPAIAAKVRNWPRFMYSYAWGVKPGEPYVFRNGARLNIGRAIDHVPIIEIFLREDYGVIPDDSTVVDLGANIGVFTVYAAKTAPRSRVYAYEPLAAFYDLLLENVRANGLEGRVECFNAAVAADSRPRTLYVEGTDFFFPTLVGGGGDDPRQVAVEVPCVALGDIIESNGLERIDLLKMDCEGAEYEILYHTPHEYFAAVREIRMEYHDLDGGERRVGRLKEFLAARGYAFTHEQANTPTNGNLWARRAS